MTLAEFYRAEATRFRERAEKASTADRASKWRRLAEEYVSLAMELKTVTEKPGDRPGLVRSRLDKLKAGR